MPSLCGVGGMAVCSPPCSSRPFIVDHSCSSSSSLLLVAPDLTPSLTLSLASPSSSRRKGGLTIIFHFRATTRPHRSNALLHRQVGARLSFINRNLDLLLLFSLIFSPRGFLHAVCPPASCSSPRPFRMTCNITETPLDFEPLPLYQRDPETSSIISSAPSYRSDAPTYHSRCSTLVDSAASPPQYIISTSLLDISAPPRLRPTASSPTTNASSRNNNNVPPASAEPPQDPTVPRSQGLPAPRSFAPGFESRSAHFIEPNPSSINHWSSIHSSHARQQYQNVARRRASRAVSMQSAQRTVALFEQHGGSNSNNSDALRTPSPPALAMSSPSAEALRPTSPMVATAPPSSSSTSPPPPSLSPPVPTTTTTAASSIPAVASTSPPPAPSNGTTATTTSSPPSSAAPSPLEDPSLVGEAAARRARQQRLYREACRRHEHAERMQAEGRAWDFLFAQMTDWEDRERSWGHFRHEVDARGFGLGGGGTAFGGRLLGSGSAGAVRFMTGGAGAMPAAGVAGSAGGRGHGRRFSVGGWHFGGRSRSRGF
ncbi:uncharacterized protein J3D65DRAFT_619704 [Phyllosticta citribraziliensis]|uniref:Uncharacterized protein n=1 Tax=Phyllosticta citribraziliensis TaxID=989973 RepID=A0ABR1LX32_9PEZI